MPSETPTVDEVRLAVATKHEHYRLKGSESWWEKITKEEAKTFKFARQAMYGGYSVGWFKPVDLALPAADTTTKK